MKGRKKVDNERAIKRCSNTSACISARAFTVLQFVYVNVLRRV